jgi:uncharacterized protein (DUF927 family)
VVASTGVFERKISPKSEEYYYEKVCSIRIMVTGRFQSVDCEDIVEVTYVDIMTQGNYLVPISAILSSKGFREHLIPKSVRVTEASLRRFFDYMNACIDANEGDGGSKFKTGFVYSTNGWKDEECTTFVAGNRIFKDNCGKLKEERCVFLDSDIANVFEEKGSLEAWVAGVNPILKYVNPRFAIYAGFTAPLMKYLNISSFGVDFYGGTPGTSNSESSSGKTTTVIIVISGFGNVKAGEGRASLFNTYDSTPKFIVNTLTKYPDLPALFDEHSELPKKVRAELAYDISSPVGRGRANSTGGTQKQQQKRNLVLMTGEYQFIPEDANTGAKVRLQEIRGGIGAQNLMEIVVAANTACMENSGHLLKLFLAEFFKNRISALNYFNAACKRLATTTDNDLTRRKSTYFAAIETAGFLLEMAFRKIGISTISPQTIVDQIWRENILASEIKPKWIIALSEVWDWYCVNIDTHFDSDHYSTGKYVKDLYGWTARPKSGHVLNINKQALSEFLQDERRGRTYDSKSIFESWRVAGLTNVLKPKQKKDGSTGSPVSYTNATRGSLTVSVIQLKLDKVYELLGIEPVKGGLSVFAQPIEEPVEGPDPFDY